MTTDPDQHSNGAGRRNSLPPATLAALWTVSNGKCYAPGCVIPVVLEVRPGVYKKNAQVAHIYGVKPGAARHQPGMDARQRDSFANLLLLCLAHHDEVDSNEDRYPPETLKKWKIAREGDQNSVLNQLTVPSADILMKFLAEIAQPPLDRLEAITERLEQTGSVTADTVTELKQIIATMSQTPGSVDERTARMLAYAAEVFASSSFNRSATQLASAAETLPSVASDLGRASARMEQFR